MDRVRFEGSRPAELFSFLRRFVLACDESNIWEGKALYLVGSFLSGSAATLFAKILPDAAGHIPGRTVASYPEAVNWLLVNHADEVTLNQAAADVNRAVLGSHETPGAFAERLRELGESCGNVYGEDRLKMVFINGLPKHLQVDAQQYNLQFPEHTLQQLASFSQGKYEQVRALQRLPKAKPRMLPSQAAARASSRSPVLAVGETTSQVGGRLEGYRGFVSPTTPVLARGMGSRTRIWVCWLCGQENHIASSSPEVPKDLQEKMAKQGLVFAKAMGWADRQTRCWSGPRRDAKAMHNLRVDFLQNVQESLYQDFPEDPDSPPEKEVSPAGTSDAGNETGEDRC